MTRHFDFPRPHLALPSLPALRHRLGREIGLSRGSVELGAVGAVALGALAIGALAIGALAINRMIVRRARIEHLSVGTLEVGRLMIEEDDDLEDDLDGVETFDDADLEVAESSPIA